MKIFNEKIENLIPYEFNNKIHDETQVNRIANSIKEFGFTQPIVIDKNNIVIIGHGRLEASKKLGLKEIPCVRMDTLNDNQVKKLRILDNKLNESDRDIANLKLELDGLENFNFGDLELVVDDLFPEFEAPEFDEDEYKDKGNVEDNYEILLKFSSSEEQQVMYDSLKEMGGFKDIKIL